MDIDSALSICTVLGLGQQNFRMETGNMDINTKAGAVIGSTIGFANSLMNVNVELIVRVLETGVLALVSGAAGALGSYLFVKILKFIKRAKSNQRTDKK